MKCYTGRDNSSFFVLNRKKFLLSVRMSGKYTSLGDFLGGLK